MNPFLHILPAFSHLGLWGYWVVFLIAFVESIVLIGVIVPGSTLIVLVGFLAAQGVLDIGDLIWFAAIGAILGDLLSYYLGTKGKDFFRDENRFLKAAHLDRGESFFKKYGDKSVFLGRFVGFLRSLVPFVAGLSKMNLKRFLFWDITSAFLWAISHLLLGYFFGSAFATIEKWTSRVGYTLGILAVAFLILYGIRMLSIQYGSRITAFLRSAVVTMKMKILSNKEIEGSLREHPKLAIFLGKRFDRGSFLGVFLTLVVIGLVYIFFTFLSTAIAVTVYGSITASDLHVEAFFHSVRSPALVNVFLWITALGTWEVVIGTAILASVIFWLWQQKKYILYLWVALGLDGFVSHVSKILVHRPRPENAVYIEHSYSFPSGHAMVAVVLYGFLTYIFIRRSKGWQARVNIFFTGLITILAIGFSRLYLGVHYLSDVWGGYLLGLLILASSISIYEWRLSRKEQANVELGKPTENIKMLTVGLILTAVAGYVLFAAYYHP